MWHILKAHSGSRSGNLQLRQICVTGEIRGWGGGMECGVGGWVALVLG